MNWGVRKTFAFACIVFAISQTTRAAVTIECVPQGGTQVTGNQTVVVECFVSSPVTEFIDGAQWDFACSLPGLAGATGGIESTLLSIEQFHSPEPYLFVGGFSGTQQGPCRAFGTPLPELPYVILPAGEVRYFSTIEFHVSECAAGSFEIMLEGMSDPPQVTDATRFMRDPWLGRPEDLIPINYNPTILNVVSGACCDGSTCLADDINPICCQQNHPSAFFLAGRSCSDPNVCRCLGDPECGDLVTCNGQEVCELETGQCQSGPPLCPSQGFFCYPPEYDCVGMSCLDDSNCDDFNACNGQEQCDRIAQNCVLGEPVVCDDLNPCNGRAECDPATGQCLPGTPSNCDDGVFCNGLESCDPQLGCVPSEPPCAEGLECDETRDECFFPGIPTVSTWGLAVLGLLLAAGAKIRFRTKPPMI
jgi:hypothetical protein